MNEQQINEEYNRIFGNHTWRDDKDMYVMGAYFLEPNFNYQMGGFSVEERDKWLPQYKSVQNGECDVFLWMRENAKTPSNIIIDLDEKNEHLKRDCHLSVVSPTQLRKEYFLFDDSQTDGIELDIYCATKADAIRIFNGNW